MSQKTPSTPAIHFLRRHKIDFQTCFYHYEDHGGTRVAARELEVPEHQVIKTLVMEDEHAAVLLMLMHGDQEVSTKALARAVKAKKITPSSPKKALQYTGYQVGGISPFGTRRQLPVYMERSITRLPFIYLNGGRRGLLIRLKPADVTRILHPGLVEVSRPGSHS